MYLPTAFRQDDLAELHAQIRANPFALLASAGSEGVQANHLPLLLEPEEGEFGTLYATSPGPIRIGVSCRAAARRWRYSPARTPTSAPAGIRPRSSMARWCRPGTTSRCTPAARSS